MVEMEHCQNYTLHEIVWRSLESNGSVRLSYTLENFPVSLYSYVVLCTFVISGLGLVGNTLSFFIHVQPAFRSNFTLLLAGLALWDILNLISTILLSKIYAEPVIIWFSKSCENFTEYKEFALVLLLKTAGIKPMCKMNFRL